MIGARRQRVAALLATSVLLSAHASLAAPPTKQECAAAHEDAQRLKQQGKLRAAREKLLVCSRDPCPRIVQEECVPWLASVEHDQPTIVFEVRAADGSDLADVRVQIDGEVVQDHLDGRPVDVDPGTHQLHIEPQGAAAVDRSILVVEGEKARVVRVDLAATGATAAGGTGNGSGNGNGNAVGAGGSGAGAGGGATTTSGIGWPTYALAGVGAIGLGGFAILGLSGLSAEHGLDSCKPACQPDRVDSVRREYIVADVFLVVGVVAVAAAIVSVVARPSRASHSAASSVYLPTFARNMLK